MWRTLHMRARAYAPGPPAAEHAWLATFIGELPCPECRRHATQFVADNPPFLENSAAYQLWAFQFHNAVSSRLGKPLFTLAQYKNMYGH